MPVTPGAERPETVPDADAGGDLAHDPVPPLTEPRTNRLAIASLVASVLGLFSLIRLVRGDERAFLKRLGLAVVESVGGVGMGMAALAQIETSEGQEHGRPLAVAGIALGGVNGLLTVGGMRMAVRLWAA